MTWDEATQQRSAIDVMQGHASVRRFTNEPINDELLATLIDAGTCASTSSNMQSYTIISISEPDHKKHLAELCADQRQIHESAVFLAFCADLHRLSLCAEMYDAEPPDFGVTEGLLVAVVDTALVMQNVAVAAESVGLGMCMIGAMRDNPHAVRDALRLPQHVFAVAGMCLGWPAERHAAKPRLTRDAVWHHERYRGDDELRTLIDAYDEILSAHYRSQGLHPKDPRWSSVMSKRVGALADRSDVGRLLRDQGLNTQSD